MNQNYYNTTFFTHVRINGSTKLYRIRKHDGVPYITYKRKTRVLFKNPVGGAYINVYGTRVYFV